METDYIARLLLIPEATVEMALENIPESVRGLKTPKEAWELYHKCKATAKPEILKRWEELVQEAIPFLKTPEEAARLYNISPSSMKNRIIRKISEM